MAWYSVGSVGVTNGSATVTGTGTDWISGARVGDGFKGPDGEIYQISSINSATSITLGETYKGSTTSGAAYSIAPTQSLTANLASQVTTLITDYQTGLDAIDSGIFKAANGAVTTPSLTFANDLNTGIYSIAADNLGVAVSGVKVLDLVSTGVNANLRFLDNKKATFGASDDLQIYHDGGNSWIKDTGAGNLRISANSYIQLQNDAGTQTMALFNDGGDVSLRYAGAQKLATTVTGIDVTGTVVADGLTVDGVAQLSAALPYIDFMETDTTDLNTRVLNEAGSFRIASLNDAKTAAPLRFKLDHATGDISFYEDTGTTAMFKWVAASEQLQLIGGNGLAIDAGISSEQMSLDGAGGSFRLKTFSGNAATSNSSVYRIGLDYASGTDSNGFIHFYRGSSAGDGWLTFETNGAERARITSSGDFYVGAIDGVGTTAGFKALSDGLTRAVRASGAALAVSRLTTDGDIAVFQKDGVTVGGIGVEANILQIKSDTTAGDGVFIADGTTNVAGFVTGENTWRPAGDNTYNLGKTDRRWKDLYLSGGVYLGGTVAANYLDDYEEGVFTPVLEGTTTAGSGTYTAQAGRYTKVGNLVTFSIYLTWSAHTGTGSIQVAGLPFTPLNTSLDYYTCAIHAENLATTASFLTAIIADTATNVLIRQNNSNASASTVTMDTSAGPLLITGQYYTSA